MITDRREKKRQENMQTKKKKRKPENGQCFPQRTQKIADTSTQDNIAICCFRNQKKPFFFFKIKQGMILDTILK